jgi:hypothetical protein
MPASHAEIRADHVNGSTRHGQRRVQSRRCAAAISMRPQRTSHPSGWNWWIVLVIILRGYAALRQGDIARAADLFAEGITDAKGLHHTPALLGAMAGLAGVALECGQAERAARLLGAIDATRESVGIEHIRSWLHAERIANDTRAALEAATFGRACLAGRTAPFPPISLDELVPPDHFYRHLERTLDLSFVRDLVRDAYAPARR